MGKSVWQRANRARDGGQTQGGDRISITFLMFKLDMHTTPLLNAQAAVELTSHSVRYSISWRISRVNITDNMDLHLEFGVRGEKKH